MLRLSRDGGSHQVSVRSTASIHHVRCALVDAGTASVGNIPHLSSEHIGHSIKVRPLGKVGLPTVLDQLSQGNMPLGRYGRPESPLAYLRHIISRREAFERSSELHYLPCQRREAEYIRCQIVGFAQGYFRRHVAKRPGSSGQLICPVFELVLLLEYPRQSEIKQLHVPSTNRNHRRAHT